MYINKKIIKIEKRKKKIINHRKINVIKNNKKSSKVK